MIGRAGTQQAGGKGRAYLEEGPYRLSRRRRDLVARGGWALLNQACKQVSYLCTVNISSPGKLLSIPEHGVQPSTVAGGGSCVFMCHLYRRGRRLANKCQFQSFRILNAPAVLSHIWPCHVRMKTRRKRVPGGRLSPSYSGHTIHRGAVGHHDMYNHGFGIAETNSLGEDSTLGDAEKEIHLC